MWDLITEVLEFNRESEKWVRPLVQKKFVSDWKEYSFSSRALGKDSHEGDGKTWSQNRIEFLIRGCPVREVKRKI